MVKLVGETVRDRTDKEYIVVAQDDENGYFSLNADNSLKTFSIRVCFLNGIFKAVNGDLQARILQELNKPNIQPQVVPKRPVEELHYFQDCGAKAKTIYEMCCKRYGFKQEYSGKFGLRQGLYAADATPEGYSVWFLAHSNWTGTENGKWKNTIKPLERIITEQWNHLDSRFYYDNGIRIVFAKNKNMRYVFLGIYKVKGSNISTRTKEYELMCTKYPK